MWVVQESSYHRSSGNSGGGCGDWPASSHLVAYLAESCLPHDTGYFKASCNTNETVSVSEYTSSLCVSSSYIRSTSRPTGCLSLSSSGNGTARFKYSCVASWRDAFPRNRAFAVHKMFSDNNCGQMVGLHAMSYRTCVAQNESASWHAEYPTLTQYRIDSNNNNNSDICAQSSVERILSLPTSCGPSVAYFPSINGQLFTFSTSAAALYGQYTLIQADNSDSAGFPMVAIYGIIAGAVGLSLLILSALLLQQYGYCTFSQLRVFPQHAHSGTAHANSSGVDEDGSVAVISLARVEPEPPAVVEAALVANPSPIKGRQFPSAYPVSPYSSSPVQMFAEFR